jgi:hypothetical protein
MNSTKRLEYHTSYTLDNDAVQVTVAEVYDIDGKSFLGEVSSYTLSQTALGPDWSDDDIVAGIEQAKADAAKALAPADPVVSEPAVTGEGSAVR